MNGRTVPIPALASTRTPAERLAPWAAVPVPLLLAAVGVFWLLDIGTPHEFPRLLTFLNFTFVTCTAALVALLAGRAFVATGTPGVLLLGSGVLLMGTAFVVAPVAGEGDPNVIATVHNVGMLATGLLSLGGAWSSYRPRPPVRIPALALGSAYVAAIGFVLGTAYLAMGRVTPTFFVQGSGGTPLRQVVLATCVALFGAAGLVLVLAPGSAVAFRRWYALGLALLGIGIVAIMLQDALGSPIGWLGRISQYLGGVYLLVASLAHATATRRWSLPLEAELREERAQSRMLREARAQLTRILDGSNDGFWDWDIQSGQVDFSDRWAEMFGYRKSELAPHISTWQGMVHPEDRAAAQGAMKRIVDGEVSRYEAQRRIRHQDGHWVWVLVRGKVVERSGDGNPTRMAGTYTDISELKAAEEAIRETSERLSLVLDGSSDGFWDWDIPSGRVEFSRRWASMLGYDLAELEPHVSTWQRLVHPEDVGTAMAAVDAHLRGETSQYQCEHRVLHKDGRWIWILDRGKVVRRDEAGRPRRMAGTHTDVTERIQAAEALRVRRSKLDAYFNNPSAGIAVVGPDLGWIEANHRYCELLGYSWEELEGRTIADVTHPDDVEISLRQLGQVVAGEIDAYSLDKRFVRKDGSILWALLSVSCSRRPDRTVEFIFGVIHDIGARKAAERALAESEERLATFVEHTPTAIAMFDREMRYLAASREWARMLGVEVADVVGRSHHDVYPLVPETWRAMHRRCLAGSIERSEEDRLPKPDGRFDWVRWEAHPWLNSTGEIGGIVMFAEVTTARREFLRQAAVSSRLAAMGTLVAGLAHEINNPLAAEMAGQGLALEVARESREQLRAGAPVDPAAKVRELDSVIEALEDAQEGGARVAKIVRDMAAFAQPSSTRGKVRLRAVVDETLPWVPKALLASSDVVVDELENPEVWASAGQLGQVVLNLLTNALKATRPGCRGNVRISLGTGDAGEATLEVTDQGVGIAPDSLNRVFEPFFTTRPTGEGRGAGLGLAICQSIAAAHGGKLTVASEVGKGSTFRLALPPAPASWSPIA